MVKLSIRNLFDVPSRRIQELDFQQDIFIHHTLGLGDMIHFNGMVRYLLDDLSADRKIRVFCKTRNAPMTRWMYRDEPRVELVEIGPEESEGRAVQRALRRNRTKNFLCLGHRAMRPLLRKYPHTFFDPLFYLQAEVPYSIRYSHCYWAREHQQEERVYKKLITDKNMSRGGYAFVHDDPERGYRVQTDRIELPIVGNDISESIFHLGLVLERAAEVHCMESSIRCMIESLKMQDVKLFYHNFRYPERPLGRATQLGWEQIEYAKDPSRKN